MDIRKIELISIQGNTSIIEALKRMDETYKRLLLVFNGNKFLNILSIGDIQRAIIKNIDLNTKIIGILRKDTKLAFNSESFENIKSRMLAYRMECMPVLSENGELVEVYFWEDVFPVESVKRKKVLNLPVVIMAGGKGTRLRPLTNVIPKPLIPLGDKSILEEIIDRFQIVGCNDFYLSLNYKAEMIQNYFKQIADKRYNLNYFQEDKPLGTAGSLYLIKNKIDTTFFVSNCDIIVEDDYSEILDYHKQYKNELTIVSALKHYPIPYGTIKTGIGGKLTSMIEKPELTIQINTGLYILEPHLLNEIPEHEFFHITQLIENIQKRNGCVGVFPVSEGSWKDIGEWDEYLKKVR